MHGILEKALRAMLNEVVTKVTSVLPQVEYNIKKRGGLDIYATHRPTSGMPDVGVIIFYNYSSKLICAQAWDEADPGRTWSLADPEIINALSSHVINILTDAD